jgi:hypothetical protein
MKIANRCAGIEAEQMEPPIKRLQLRMGVANRAFGLDNRGSSLQMTAECGVGMLDGGWRLESTCDGLDICTGRIAQLLGDVRCRHRGVDRPSGHTLVYTTAVAASRRYARPARIDCAQRDDVAEWCGGGWSSHLGLEPALNPSMCSSRRCSAH